MLDRSRADAVPPRARAIAFAIAACLSLAFGAWLAYIGTGYVTDGCGCYDPIRDEIVGVVLLAAGAGFGLAAIALAFRAWRVARLKADS